MPLPMRKTKVKPPSECPIASCMELLGGAWGPNVIWHLSQGARRFSELQVDMRPISAKVLSVRLKELERKGIVSRVVVASSPPSVEYSLTPVGVELVPAIEAIAEVGFKLQQQRSESPA